MKVLYAKCENGHFYDVAQGEKCPKCGTTVYTLLGEKPHRKKEDADKAKMGKKKEKEERNKAESDVRTQKANEQSGAVQGSDKVTDVWQDFPSTISAGVSPEPGENKTAVVKLVSGMNKAGETKAEPKLERDESKTIAFWDRASDMQLEPVVGWLVCIKGESAGAGYELRTGANKVGRLEKVNDVVISGDMHISGKEHLVITFEPKAGKFYIQPGAGMSLSYINGKLLSGVAVLNDRDRIELGASTLIFVALCGEAFNWND